MLSLLRFLLHEAPPITPRSTMILLDRSSTMNILCRRKRRVDWGLQACDQVRGTMQRRYPKHGLGLIVFNHLAVVVQEITAAGRLPPVDLSWIEADGYTSLSAGLRQAQPRVKAGDQILLLTDGLHNHGEDPLVAASEIKNAGVQIDVIGIGEPQDLDQTQLRQIATTDDAGVVHYRFIGDLQLLAGHLVRVTEKRIRSV